MNAFVANDAADGGVAAPNPVGGVQNHRSPEGQFVVTVPEASTPH